MPRMLDFRSSNISRGPLLTDTIVARYPSKSWDRSVGASGSELLASVGGGVGENVSLHLRRRLSKFESIRDEVATCLFSVLGIYTTRQFHQRRRRRSSM